MAITRGLMTEKELEALDRFREELAGLDAALAACAPAHPHARAVRDHVALRAKILWVEIEALDLRVQRRPAPSEELVDRETEAIEIAREVVRMSLRLQSEGRLDPEEGETAR